LYFDEFFDLYSFNFFITWFVVQFLSLGLTAQPIIEVSQSISVIDTFGTGIFGGGVSFSDFDGDGWDDISLTTEKGKSISFYRNIGGALGKIESCNRYN